MVKPGLLAVSATAFAQNLSPAQMYAYCMANPTVPECKEIWERKFIHFLFLLILFKLKQHKSQLSQFLRLLLMRYKPIFWTLPTKPKI